MRVPGRHLPSLPEAFLSSIPKSEVLRDLYWRSEILRVMYWLRGEGLGDVVDVPMIRRYLDIGGRECRTRLSALADAGEVVRDGTWYALSDTGLAEGEAEFATMFSDLAKPTPGACSAECWCQVSSAEAEACGGALPTPTRKGTIRR